MNLDEKIQREINARSPQNFRTISVSTLKEWAEEAYRLKEIRFDCHMDLITIRQTIDELSEQIAETIDDGPFEPKPSEQKKEGAER